jgi:hypothetical protein
MAEEAKDYAIPTHSPYGPVRVVPELSRIRIAVARSDTPRLVYNGITYAHGSVHVYPKPTNTADVYWQSGTPEEGWAIRGVTLARAEGYESATESAKKKFAATLGPWFLRWLPKNQHLLAPAQAELRREQIARQQIEISDWLSVYEEGIKDIRLALEKSMRGEVIENINRWSYPRPGRY